MSIANWCVLAASALPLFTVNAAKASRVLAAPQERYDNSDPRGWEARLSGWQQRAVAAQNNGFEGLPFFIGAVILAQQAHAEQGRIDQLALAYVGARIAFTVIYLLDLGPLGALRSVVWLGGLGASIGLLLLST
jgi:uncharacterized MAPEG superfamily protein